MFVDARQEDEARQVPCTVCVIGAGAAGITMALELERLGIDAVVLESGGFGPDEQTMDLYRGESVGIPYEFGDGFRSRFLGGGSNCWGGWCRPLEREDLVRRDWVPHSGWPISREELMPYYTRAHQVLSLGPENFDVGYWARAIDRPDVRRMPLASGQVEDSISQFSRPTRFGKHYRAELRAARHVRVYLYANVVDIETESTGQSVRTVQVRTLSGRRFSVSARIVVLACGGIENARILLACNRNHAGGLGNANDLVGRYFMDHPRLMLGKLRFSESWRRNKLYDIKFHYLNRTLSLNGTHVAAQMSVSAKAQEREGLLNGRIWFSSFFPGEGTAAAAAIVRMKHRLHLKVDPQHSFLRDAITLARDPWSTLNFVAARQMPAEGSTFFKELHFRLIKEAEFQMICEPAPNPDSRVTLAVARDALGMPRARVDWRLDELVKRTFDRSIAIVAQELREAGIAEVLEHEPLQGRPWPRSLEGTWHHMGTTRMHDSPTRGVVDRNCRIHGMSNLYVTGSSVFPTAGANFPTITLVALALRLVEHLRSQLQQPDATAGAGVCVAPASTSESRGEPVYRIPHPG